MRTSCLLLLLLIAPLPALADLHVWYLGEAPPGRSDATLIQKGGAARWARLAADEHGATWVQVEGGPLNFAPGLETTFRLYRPGDGGGSVVEYVGSVQQHIRDDVSATGALIRTQSWWTFEWADITERESSVTNPVIKKIEGDKGPSNPKWKPGD